MLSLSVLTARGRMAAFTGALVALMAASVLTMAWGMQLESVLRGDPAVERYAGTTAVVTGQQTVGAGADGGARRGRLRLGQRGHHAVRAQRRSPARGTRPGRGGIPGPARRPR